MLYAQNKSFVNFVTEKFFLSCRRRQIAGKSQPQLVQIHHTLYGNEQSYFRKHNTCCVHTLNTLKCTSHCQLLWSFPQTHNKLLLPGVRLLSQIHHKVLLSSPSGTGVPHIGSFAQIHCTNNPTVAVLRLKQTLHLEIKQPPHITMQ